MNILLRDLNASQLKEYKDFLAIGLLKDENSFRLTPRDDLNANFPTRDTEDSFTIGAYAETTLAGVVSFTRDGTDREKLKHKGILFRMYVSPLFRGQGIAKQLIQTVIKRASQLDNMEQINLTVVASNNIAKAFYEKLGFVTYGRERNAIKWKGKYFDEEMMSFKIQNS